MSAFTISGLILTLCEVLGLPLAGHASDARLTRMVLGLTPQSLFLERAVIHARGVPVLLERGVLQRCAFAPHLYHLIAHFEAVLTAAILLAVTLFRLFRVVPGEGLLGGRSMPSHARSENMRCGCGLYPTPNAASGAWIANW